MEAHDGYQMGTNFRACSVIGRVDSRTSEPARFAAWFATNARPDAIARPRDSNGYARFSVADTQTQVHLANVVALTRCGP